MRSNDCPKAMPCFYNTVAQAALAAFRSWAALLQSIANTMVYRCVGAPTCCRLRLRLPPPPRSPLPHRGWPGVAQQTHHACSAAGLVAQGWLPLQVAVHVRHGFIATCAGFAALCTLLRTCVQGLPPFARCFARAAWLHCHMCCTHDKKQSVPAGSPLELP